MSCSEFVEILAYSGGAIMLMTRNARKQDAKIVSVTLSAKYDYLDMLQRLERTFFM